MQVKKIAIIERRYCSDVPLRNLIKQERVVQYQRHNLSKIYGNPDLGAINSAEHDDDVQPEYSNVGIIEPICNRQQHLFQNTCFYCYEYGYVMHRSMLMFVPSSTHSSTRMLNLPVCGWLGMSGI